MTDIKRVNDHVTTALRQNSDGSDPFSPLSDIDEYEKGFGFLSEELLYGPPSENRFVAGMPLSAHLVATSFFIFFRAGYPEDWCIQSMSVGESVIFGGYNRVAFYYGKIPYWFAHTTHCSPKFLEGVRKHCPWVVIPGDVEVSQ